MLAAGLLAAAGGAVGVLWVVSYRFPPNRAGGDVLNFTREDPLWWVISSRGRITLCRQDGQDWGPEFPGFDVGGFAYGGHRGPNGSLYNLAVPHWFVAAVLLAPPAACAASAWRGRRRRKPGRCRSCGYDLTGNVSGVCPECGATAATAQAESQHRGYPDAA